MSETADCLVTDIARTVNYYRDKTDTTTEMKELVMIAEQMAATIFAVRQTQIMRATLRKLREPTDKVAGSSAAS